MKETLRKRGRGDKIRAHREATDSRDNCQRRKRLGKEKEEDAGEKKGKGGGG